MANDEETIRGELAKFHKWQHQYKAEERKKLREAGLYDGTKGTCYGCYREVPTAELKECSRCGNPVCLSCEIEPEVRFCQNCEDDIENL